MMRVFIARDWSTETRLWFADDFMHILIDEFGKHVRGEGGRVVVSGADALVNLQYQIVLLKQADWSV